MVTNSDAVIKELKFRFGDKEYVVPVLRSIPAAKWREQYFKESKEICDSMPMHFEHERDPKKLADAVGRGLMNALLRFPEKIPEMIFSYAPCLAEKKEEIIADAYDQDYIRAFAQIWQVAFEPFLGSLGMVMEMHRAQTSTLAPSKVVN